MKEHEFKVGDVVAINSDDKHINKMTVLSLWSDTTVRCGYFDAVTNQFVVMDDMPNAALHSVK